MTTVPSILIPAHDEEAVVGDTLACLLDGLDPRVQVVVICNGCRDRTASIARAAGERVQVVEIQTASKTVALNTALSGASPGAVVVLDADILFRGSDATHLIEALEVPGALAVEPVPQMDLLGSSWAVRAYYAVWFGLHGGRPGKVGGGVLGLSSAGLQRIGAFPDVISDDGWVRAHFEGEELVYLDSCHSVVIAPRNVADLIRIKTRSRLGTKQLRLRFPELQGESVHKGGWTQRLRRLGLRSWLQVPTYLFVTVVAELRARRSLRGIESYVWEKDQSSRQASRSSR